MLFSKRPDKLKNKNEDKQRCPWPGQNFVCYALHMFINEYERERERKCGNCAVKFRLLSIFKRAACLRSSPFSRGVCFVGGLWGVGRRSLDVHNHHACRGSVATVASWMMPDLSGILRGGRVLAANISI